MSNNKFFKSGFGSNFGSWSQLYKKDTTSSSNATDAIPIEAFQSLEQQVEDHTIGLQHKVDVVPGKSLTDNNLTDALEHQLKHGATTSKDVTILEPEDARMSLAGKQTGAIKVTLPQYYTTTMMKLEIDIYDHMVDESVKILLGGFNYSGGSWTKTFAQIIGTKDTQDYNIRFGNDGTNCCIYIGDIDSEWHYPKVAVTKGMFSYVNYDYNKWISGWRLEVTTQPLSPAQEDTLHKNNMLYRMTDAERSKLDGIESGANQYVHPSTHSMSEISGLTASLDTKVDAVSGKGLSTFDFDEEQRARLTNNVVELDKITLLQPKDASLQLGGSQTGAFRIELPPSGPTSTMMKLEVDIFDLSTDKSVKFLISGNNSSSGTWNGTSVQILSDKPELNYPVRFAQDNGKHVIYIGAVDSNWKYPKVCITQGLFSYLNYNYTRWIQGWNVSLVTSITGVVDHLHTENILSFGMDALETQVEDQRIERLILDTTNKQIQLFSRDGTKVDYIRLTDLKAALANV